MKSKVKRKKIFCLENNVSFIWSKLFCQCNYWSIELVAVVTIFVIIAIWSILKNLSFAFHRIAFYLLLIFFHTFSSVWRQLVSPKRLYVFLTNKKDEKQQFVLLFADFFFTKLQFKLWNPTFQFLFFSFR